jgi:hypothetical protein
LDSLCIAAAIAGQGQIYFILLDAGGLKIAAGALKSLNGSVEMMAPKFGCAAFGGLFFFRVL